MMVWRRLRNDRVGMICLCFLLAVAALALCAPLAAPWDPTAIDVRNKFAGYSLAHLLGTDQLGRDVLSRLIWGGRATLGFSLLTMGITCPGGLIASLGMGLVEAALHILNDMRTFAETRVAVASDGPGAGRQLQ